MRLKPPVYFIALTLVLWGTVALADQVILRDGTVYSGKFMRGDSKVVDFRILGRVESFKTSEISRIVFDEPEPEASSSAPKKMLSTQPVQAEPAAAEERPRTQTAPRAARAQSISPTTVTVASGMPLTVRTTTEIDTERNRVGDPFEAILDQDLVSGTQTVVPRGAVVKGKIAYAKESGKLTGQSTLILELTDLVAYGKNYPLNTTDYTEVGSSRGSRTAKTVGGTAAVGAIIGAIAGGGKGAAIGAASGAAVGTGVQVITKGQVLRIPSETILEFRLQSPLTIEIP